MGPFFTVHSADLRADASRLRALASSLDEDGEVALAAVVRRVAEEVASGAVASEVVGARLRAAGSA